MSAAELPEVFAPLLQPARYKGAHGGRGSGKSHAFALMAVLALVSRPGVRIVCVREVQISIADSVKRLLEDKIAELGLGAFFRITDHEIRGKNDSLCIFRGLQNHTAASIKSLEGFDIAWIEEAQSIKKASLELLTPTIRKPGSELWFSWNPVQPTDPVDVLLRKDPPANAIVVEANYWDNPHFPPDLMADMERDKARDHDKYWHVWCGKYQTLSEARIFKNWTVDERKVGDLAVWFYGVDFGFSVDAAAALRCTLLDRTTLYIDREAWEVGVPTEALPAFLHRVDGIEAWPSRADSARPETIDYLKRHGLPKMRPAKKGKGSLEDGIQFLQGLDIVVHPRCVNTIRELGLYSYKVDKHSGEILPIPEDDHNHLMDALRYAVERLHRKGKQLAVPEAEDMGLQRPPDYQGRQLEDYEGWKVA